jgi:general secretion pathway protein G
MHPPSFRCHTTRSIIPQGSMSMRGARRAFTLIEVMIVILIVLALGGIVAYNVMGSKKEADQGTVKIQMKSMQSALREFRVTHNRYPTDEEGLRVLWDKEATTDELVLKSWRRLLEDPVPNDMWGSPWGYRQKSEHVPAGGDEDKYDIWSVGPDKVEGTPDDVVSWSSDDSGSGGGSPASGGGGGGGGGGGASKSGG